MAGVLSGHGVDYLLVGGVAAAIHGAAWPTGDVDCLPHAGAGNLNRLAAAMREINARLRIGGLDDAEAALLPMVLDGLMLASAEISTWRTDAGNLDVLSDIPDRNGRLLDYDELVERADVTIIEGVTVGVASLEDVIASKEWADRPKDRRVLAELRELRTALPVDREK